MTEALARFISEIAIGILVISAAGWAVFVAATLQEILDELKGKTKP